MHQPPPTPAGLLVLAPAAALAVAGLVFLVVWRMRGQPPILRGLRAAITGGLTAALPFGAGAGRGPGAQGAAAGGGAVAALGIVVPALLFVRANWTQHLQFVPWRDIKVVALVVAAGLVLAFALRGRTPRGHAPAGPSCWRRRRWRWCSPCGPAGAEAARKAAASEAGLVGPLLGLGAPGAGLRSATATRACWAAATATTGTRRSTRPPRTGPKTASTRTATASTCAPPICGRRRCTRCPPRVPPQPQHPADRHRHPARRSPGRLRLRRVRPRPSSTGWPRDGVLFENAWAHAPSTRYSMPAIVTGRWPSAIKWDMSIWWPGIARDQPHHRRGDARARATSTAPTTPIRTSTASTAAASSAASISTTTAWPPSTSNVGGPAESIGSSAREMADDGIDFLRSYQDQKFFLTLHFYDPHLDYERHPERARLRRRPSPISTTARSGSPTATSAG